MDLDACRCGKTFCNTYVLRRHKKSCTGSRPQPKSKVCAACEITFTRSHALTTHQSRGVCGRKASRVIDRRFESVYRCTRCPSTHLDKTRLTRHLRNVHGLGPGADLVAELAAAESAAASTVAVVVAAARMAAAMQVVEDILAPRLTFEEDGGEGGGRDRLFDSLFDPML
jgi:uncharacterized C2H2 Zn-finger protein